MPVHAPICCVFKVLFLYTFSVCAQIEVEAQEMYFKKKKFLRSAEVEKLTYQYKQNATQTSTRETKTLDVCGAMRRL